MIEALAILVLAVLMFGFFVAMVGLLSSDWFVRAFGWTLDHPAITGLAFCVALAAVIVLRSAP